MIFSNRAAFGSAAAAALFFASAAVAQQPPQSQTGTPAEATLRVTDDHLRSFAMAVIDLEKINQELAPKLEGAAPEQKQAVQEEAHVRMTAAVKKQELDLETFGAIAAAAKESPELAQKIGGYVQEAAPAR